jgi:MFS family permease
LTKPVEKKWLLLALLLYAISGTSGFFLNNLHLILVGRAFLGLAVAGIMTICTTLVGDYFIGAERGSFLGLQGAFISLGGVFFITLAGWFADIGWQMPFLIYLFSVPVLILASIVLYEPEVVRYKNETRADGSIKKTSYNKLLIGIIYLTVFIAIVCFYMVPVQLPFMLKSLGGVSNTMVGYAISISTLFSAIVSINYQRIKRNVSFPLVLLFSFTLMGLGYYLISQSTTYPHYLFSLAFSGMGVGLLMPTGSLWVMEIAPPEMRGRLISGVSTSMFLGMFFSPIFVQPLVRHANIGYSGAFLAASILLWFMALLFFFFRKAICISTINYLGA